MSFSTFDRIVYRKDLGDGKEKDLRKAAGEGDVLTMLSLLKDGAKVDGTKIDVGVSSRGKFYTVSNGNRLSFPVQFTPIV